MNPQVVPSLAVAGDPSPRGPTVDIWADLPQLREALDALIACQSRHEQVSRDLQEISRELERIDAERRTRLRTLEHLLTTAGKPLGLVRTSADPRVMATRQQNSAQELLPSLEITCFGGFEVRRAGRPVQLCSNRNGQAILRFLVAQSRHRASMDVLVDALWPNDAPEVARHKLHCAFSALRRSLNNGYTDRKGGGYLLCRDTVYELNPAVVMRIDQDEFLARHHSGRQASGNAAIAHYEAACSLYKDPFLPEDLYADWSLPHREQLETIYLMMCRTLAAHCLTVAQPEEAAAWASRIIELSPCDESAFRQLMLACAATGRRDEVVRQYRRCELLLRDELDVQPSRETTALLDSILLR